MTEEQSRMPLSGSSRPAPPHPRVADPDPENTVTVTLYLRGSGAEPGPGHLSREEYAARHGAASADIEAVRRFAAAHDLHVGDIDLGRRSVALSGRLGDMAAAFGASVGIYQAPGGDRYQAREGGLTLPTELGAVTGVFGLDERPAARPQFRPRDSASNQYAPTQVAAAYDFPTGTTGSGECVALIELGGGFREDDLSDYFASLGIPLPSVAAVGVLGAENRPGKPNGPDGEVMLDIEVLGSVAPGASIAVYFAPNTDQGFIEAVTMAVHDTTRRPSVVSISWGSAESTWTSQAMQQMEQAFAAAAAMGVTVTVAAGDNGSGDGQTDGLAHVDFPASAPHALACGGTRLLISGTRVTSETVWNDGAGGGAGGGGISDVFGVPAYQQGAGIPVSANGAAAPAEVCPTSAATPTPTRATWSGWTVPLPCPGRGGYVREPGGTSHS